MSQVCIGIFTSGGDSCGMNASVRACTRFALSNGAKMFAIYNGFRGMYTNDIKELQWDDVAGILAKGGTVIGTARCKEFREKAGRRIAARNLVKSGINSLICVGGDGSLTGANILLEEWSEHLQALLLANEITQAEMDQAKQLKLVGFAGTIDNDMFGTDATIGVWTALTRIVEAIDCLMSTAESHQRAFVVECMGRHAGYLSLMAALVTSAEYVFIPEAPPCYQSDDPDETWQEDMCRVLRNCRTKFRASVIVVCEGAIDRFGNPIYSADVQKVLQERLGVDSRLTVLGHVQRGGVPVPADRFVATMMSFKAVEILLNEPKEPLCIGVRGTKLVALPLQHCVAKCRAGATASKALEFDKCQELRCDTFREMLSVMQTQAAYHAALPDDCMEASSSQSTLQFKEKPSALKSMLKEGKGKRVGILTCGAPAPGMSACIGAVARMLLARGSIPLGIRNGFIGLTKAKTDADLVLLRWFTVRDCMFLGGSPLSCTRQRVGGDVLPEQVAEALKTLQLDALVVIGGFEAYTSVHMLMKERRNHDALNVPLLLMPATISSNLPGSDYSVGCDRGLCNLVEAVDKVKQSAVGMRRLFVMEVMGRQCGFLTLIGAICSGADAVMLPEVHIDLCDFEKDRAAFQKRFRNAADKESYRCAVLIKNEKAGGNVFTLEFLCNLYASNSRGDFDVRRSVLGHLQQGGLPTVLDRLTALRLSVKLVDRLMFSFKENVNVCECVGIVEGEAITTCMSKFPEMVDLENRRPKHQWWMEMLPAFHQTA